MRRRSVGPRPVAAGLLVLAALSVLLVAAAPTRPAAVTGSPYPFACDTSPAVRTDGDWTVVSLPRFADGAGGTQARRHAVDPRNPARIYVTNGTSVQRTTDGGCTWSEVFDLSTGPSPDRPITATAQIVDVRVVTQPSSGTWVNLLILDAGRLDDALGLDGGSGNVVPWVARSGDDGNTWAVSNQGLAPLAGDAGDGRSGYCGPTSGCLLRVPAQLPTLVYVALRPSRSGPGVLYLSRDHGANFESHPAPPGASTDGFEQLEVDPRNAQWLWAAHGGLWRSGDAGSSWEALDDGLEGFHALLDAAPDPAGGRRLVSALGTQRGRAPTLAGVAVSADDGATFAPRTPASLGLDDVAADSLGHGSTPDDLVLLAPDAFHVFAPDRDAFVPLDDHGLASDYGPLRDLQDTVAQPHAYVALGTGALVVYHGPTGTELAPPPPAFDPGRFDGVPPPTPPAPASLSPTGYVVEVDPPAPVEVAYTLDLPARSRPTDVFFLVDASASQRPSLDGLRAGIDDIATTLARSGRDVQFGLGIFQESGSSTVGVRYERLVDVGPLTAAFPQALADIEPVGSWEPHTTALDQLVTGSGVLHPRRGRGVAPGQQATWRPGSIRVVVLITDEPYDYGAQGDPDYNPPDPEAPPVPVVLERLRGVGAHLVGIQVLDADGGPSGIDPTNPTGVRQDLQAQQRRQAREAAVSEQLGAWARATGATAPAGGIDCDADGEIDLDEGTALVCRLPEEADGLAHLETAVARLVDAFPDVRPVQLAVVDDGGARVQVTPAADYGALNVKSDQRLTFAVTFGCDESQRGRDLPLELAATVGGDPVASTSATVACAAAPVAPAPAAAPPQPGNPPPAPAPQPPAPVQAPVQAPAPAAAGAPAQAQAASSAAAGAPAAAPGLSPGGAVAETGPAERQVVLAHAEHARRQAELLQATAAGDDALPITTWAAALLLTVAAGAVAGRGRRQPARAAVTRRRASPRRRSRGW